LSLGRRHCKRHQRWDQEEVVIDLDLRQAKAGTYFSQRYKQSQASFSYPLGIKRPRTLRGGLDYTFDWYQRDGAGRPMLCAISPLPS
jgi:hypothetical protein